MEKVYKIFEMVEFDLAEEGVDNNGYALMPLDEDCYTSEKKAEVRIEKYLEFGARDKCYTVKPVYSR